MLKYTILTAVLNRKYDIKIMYESVIAQTYANYEIVIVDNGSTDGTYELCKEWESVNSSVRVFQCHERGLAFARNVGIRQANSDYCIILDSDNTMFLKYSIELLNNILNKYMPLGLFTYTKNEFGWNNSKSKVINKFIDLNQYLTLVQGEFAVIVSTAWFKEHEYPEFPGLISELPFLVWIPLAKSGQLFISDCVTQKYTIGSIDSISHSPFDQKRVIELTVYYYEICRRHGSELRLISLAQYSKMLLKFLLYNRISRRYELREVFRLQIGYFGILFLIMPSFIISTGISTYKKITLNKSFLSNQSEGHEI